MDLNKEKFTGAINEKMHQIMFEQKKKLGLRYFAEQIGTSLATLQRITAFKDADLPTVLKVCTWLDKPITEFIN